MRKRTPAHRAAVERLCRENDEIVEAAAKEMNAEDHARLRAALEAHNALQREMAKEHSSIERVMELSEMLDDDALDKAVAILEKNRGMR